MSVGARSASLYSDSVPATKRPITNTPPVMIPAETAVGDMPSTPSAHSAARSPTKAATTSTICPASLRFPKTLLSILELSGGDRPFPQRAPVQRPPLRVVLRCGTRNNAAYLAVQPSQPPVIVEAAGAPS
jgi:hypothetical protein